MKTTLNSAVLVSIQFTIITLLLILNDSIFNHTLSFILTLSGFSFGVYTLFYNKLGNFNITPQIKDEAKLITKGAYKYIRHPMYFSVLLIMAGVVLTGISLINILLYMGLFFVLYLKAHKEENPWDVRIKEYGKYKKRTKMFIPFVF